MAYIYWGLRQSLKFDRREAKDVCLNTKNNLYNDLSCVMMLFRFSAIYRVLEETWETISSHNFIM